MATLPSEESTIDAVAIADALSARYGRAVPVTAITQVGNPGFKDEVADATLKFRAPCPDGEEGFLLISGAGNPQLVARAANNIRVAREHAPQQIAAPILPTVATGEIDGYSFAVWPARPAFDSNGIRRFIRRRRYAGTVIGWSTALSRETLRPGDPGTVLADLQVIAGDSAFPEEMRRDATRAASRIDRYAWRPMHCLCHGDFWSGNLLLPTRHPEEPQFHVIDWAGMQLNGYPFADLSRMLMSLRCGPLFCARSFEKLRCDVGCDKQDIISYVLSAFGQTGQNLEFFPPERYRAKAIKVYQFAQDICDRHL